jgi:hypothetical protein
MNPPQERKKSLCSGCEKGVKKEGMYRRKNKKTRRLTGTRGFFLPVDGKF